MDGGKELSEAWFIFLNERPLDGTHGPGRDLRGNKQPQDQTMCGQICGSICLMQRKKKQNKDGPPRNPSSTMPDN